MDERWKVSSIYSHLVVVESDNSSVCSVLPVTVDCPGGKTRSGGAATVSRRARMIAAAPDLLHATELLLSFVTGHSRFLTLPEKIRIAEAAIAKAKGKEGQP